MRRADRLAPTPPPAARRPVWARMPGAPAALLALIVLFGAALRFWHLGWDGGTGILHPDEWALNQAVRRLGGDLNPHFFYYGTFPIYLDRLTAEVLRLLTGQDWLAPARLPLIGRFYSALASSALPLPVFAVARRFWGGRVGLLAALLTAGAALLIQAAHFGTVDTLVALLGMVLLWLVLPIVTGAGLRPYLFAGVVLGLGAAIKLTTVSFVLLPLLAHLLRQRPPAAPDGPAARPAAWRGPLLLVASASGVCLLLAPYYVLAWPELQQALAGQTAELNGGYLFPYTWQFIGSVPYLFELQNLVVWGLGLPLGLAVLAGWAWAIAECGMRKPAGLPLWGAVWRRARHAGGSGISAQSSEQHATRNTQHATLGTRYSVLSTRYSALALAWPLAYFLYVGTWEARFVRHLLPLVPWCCLFAAGGTSALAAWLQRRGRAGAWIAALVTGAVVLGGAGWGLAVAGIYTAPEPRLAATAWVAAHVPAGSTIVIEDKNDVVPVPGAGPRPGTYHFTPLAVTVADTPAKMESFAGALARGDVLIVPNRRWSAVLPRLGTFPRTGQYYRLLFAGRLGYTPLVTFADPPHLGPFVFPDEGAEETFQVFDHPTVRVFGNTGRLGEATLRALLAAAP